MRRYFSFHAVLGGIGLALVILLAVSTSSGSAARNPALLRYPYLTDVVGSYAAINWATDRSETSGGVRYGKVGSESCTAHYVSASKLAISVNGSLQYQWTALLNLTPGTEYCYRVYLGSSPANEIDLLGTDASPSFRTQVPPGDGQSFSFIVFGDWGQVNASGTNSYQADLMALMASSGARFALTTGDNGYPSGSQKNFGDLVQTGPDISAIFGSSFWKVPGASLPIFPTLGNHGITSSDSSHPFLTTWPQDRAVATSDGRYRKETHCCLNGSSSAAYPSTWYAFDAGPARFYVLQAAWAESNVGTASEYKMDYDYHWASSTAQYKWLKNDLASHPSVLKFAFFHYPLYSDNVSEPADTYLLGSTRLEGLLKANGVDLAFTGHAHIYERNRASAAGIPNYVTGGGGATPGSLGTCTSLDAYAIKFTTSGKACGSAPVPTNPGQVYHFLKVTVNGTNVTVTPINAHGQSFDVQNYSFTSGAEATPPSTPSSLNASPVSGTQIDLSWSASSDNTGVRGYGIYRNGALVNTVDWSVLSYSDTDLKPATRYTYRVDAFDGSGNHSALSTSKAVTTQSTATYTFTPVADAYVSASTTKTNYGRATTLKADGSPVHRSYLRFNVGDLSGTVTKATLRLYTTTSSTAGYQVQAVASQGWEESSISYSNKPAVGSVLGSARNFSSGSWTSVDVTSLIMGEGVYGLALSTTSSTVINFSSRDAASRQPELVVQTSAGSIAVAPLEMAGMENEPLMVDALVVPETTSTAAAQTDVESTATLTATASEPVVESSPTADSATVTPVAIEMPVSTAVAAAPPDTLTFTTVADARVVQRSPRRNFGSSATLQVDGNPGAAQTSYIRFAVNGISAPIQNVKLRVFCTTNGTNNGPAVYLADSNWLEKGADGVSWNTQPALLSEAFDNKDAIPVNSWVEYDVTAWVTGDGTYTFALAADGKDGVTFSSLEGSAPPQLIVTLEPQNP